MSESSPTDGTRSSDGKSTGLLSQESQVRVLPGALVPGGERGEMVDAADLKSAGLGHAGSNPAARTINLYAVHERSEKPLSPMILVAAHCSQHALEFIQAAGFYWTLANTRTQRLWRNIDRVAGVIDVIGMHRGANFRHHTSRSRDSMMRRKTKKNGVVQQ
jgi:hypothetical protein